MDKWLLDILTQSLLTPSPSGSEERVTALFADAIRPFVDEITTDPNGNCIAHRKGKNGPKVMLMAHADEIGLMISYIDDRGFLYFNQIGGIDTNILPGLRVIIQGKNGPVTGIIGKKPIHLQDEKESGKPLSPDDLWIDIAATDKTDALTKVQIGSVATFEPNAKLLENDLILSKSLDDKIGLAVLIGISKALQNIPTDADLYFVASVQEELGARGAQMVSEAIPRHRLPHHVPGQGWRHSPLQRTGYSLRPEHEQRHQPVTHRHRRDQINSLSGRGHRQTDRHRCPHDPSGWPRHKDRSCQHPVPLHAHPVRDGITKGRRPRHHAFGTLFAVNSLRDRSHIV